MVSTRADSISWSAHAHVDKYTIDQVRDCQRALGLDREPIGAELLAFCTPDSMVDSEGNALTQQGLIRINNLIIGTASWQALDATHCRIGVGDSSTANSGGPPITNTTLVAASNFYFKLVDSRTVGATSAGGTVTYVATFGTSVANFAWQEWGIDGGTASAADHGTSDTATTPGIINRKVTSLGTKTSSATFVFTSTITVS